MNFTSFMCWLLPGLTITEEVNRVQEKQRRAALSYGKKRGAERQDCLKTQIKSRLLNEHGKTYETEKPRVRVKLRTVVITRGGFVSTVWMHRPVRRPPLRSFEWAPGRFYNET